MVTLPMKYFTSGLAWGTFLSWGVKFAFWAFSAHKMIGNWVWSIHPFFQSIFGCTAVNQGYPSIALCSPRSDKKKHSLVPVVPVRVFRLV
jgi:hypothetical protein